MRKFYSIFALCAFLFLSVSMQATDYTVEPTTAIKSNTLPLFRTDVSLLNSITQQIYLPSEFSPSGATAGSITAVTFYYAAKDGNTVDALSRDIEIWLMETDVESYTLDHVGFVWKSKFLCNGSNKAGTKVFDGVLNTEDAITSSSGDKTVTLTFNAPFAWDGTSNIVLTLFDKSTTTIGSNAKNYLKFYITQTTKARFVHHKILDGSSDNISSWINNINSYGDEYNSASDSAGWAGKRVYVPKTTFSITPTIPAPTNLAASSITTSSATLSWNAAAGATGYNVRWGKTSGSLDHSQNNVAATSLAISGLDDGETYFFDVQTITAGGTSAFSSEANFNTAAVTHEHDGITFSKWASTTSLPTSGDYYLNADVALDPFDPTTITLTGNLNLCLNGHTANVYGTKIVVPSDKTLAIYDNVGGGKLTGFVESEVGSADIFAKALIVVFSGGELELNQGIIENTYEHDPADSEDGWSYAIYSNGTLHLSGDVLINSNNADIYLYSNNVITLDGAISNAEKHTVYKLGGDITYGWSTHMSGEDPRDFFESANSAKSVFLDDDEAALRNLLHLSENSLNSAIKDNRDIVIDVALTRSLTSSQFNTFCLPFNLNNAQLEEIFGVGYDLEEFDHSNFDGETIELVFVKRTELTEGAPYLIKPSVDVVDPFFVGVTIHDGEPGADDWDDYINVYGTFAPTELTGGNKNLLFLGAGNELFWPAATGNIKGFRAYFEVKGAAQKAKAARIVKKEDQTQAIDNIENPNPAQKRILNGQLVIEKNGTFYNAQGQIVK